MIRRWSHLNLISTKLFFFNKFEKRCKIVNFKTVVNFKRFSFKITKFKRKTMSKWKHISSWLIYNNIIKTWVFDYIFIKNFIKIQFFNKIFINNYYVFNFNFVKIRNELFYYNFNFYISINTKKSYFYFYKNHFSFFKNNNLTFIWNNLNPELGNSVISSYQQWDNIIFEPVFNKIDDKITHNLLNKQFELFIFFLIKNLNEIRNILTMLFLNLNFKNVK